MLSMRLVLSALVLALLVPASRAQEAPLGPPPEPVYLTNTKVRATWEWAQAAYTELLVLRERIEELETAAPTPPTLPPDHAAAEISWPAFARVTWRWEDLSSADERHWRDNVYLWRVEKVTEAEWDAALSVGVQDPDPEPEPDPDPTPVPEPNPPAIGTLTIEAEAFTAAHDSDAGNKLGATGPWTAANPDVDIEVNSTGGHNVGFWATGEWLEYRTPKLAVGTWSVRLRVASPGPGGTISVDVGGSRIATVVVPDTGGWMQWQALAAGTTMLAEGEHTIRITGVSASGTHGHVANLDSIELVYLGAPSASVGAEERLVYGHEMLAMPPGGGAVEKVAIAERLYRAKHYGIDVVELFHPEAFPATAQLYYDAAAQVGMRVCLSFGYVGEDLVSAARALIERYRSHPAQHYVGGRPYVTAYHASSHMRSIVDRCHYVPHMFARGEGGGVLEQPTVDGLRRVLADWPTGLAGLASFYPLDDWRVYQPRYFDALAGTGLEFRMSITPRHEPVGHKGNWRVFEGLGLEEIAAQLQFALENRDRIDALTWVTLNDYSEGTDVLGARKAEADLIESGHWNSADWPALLARDGTLSFAQRGIAAWRTGIVPPIERLGVWVCYRLQGRDVPAGPVPHGKPGEWQKLVDAVFVAVRNPGPDPVAIRVNAETRHAPAGESHLRFAHAPGPVEIGWPGGSRALPAIVATAAPGAWKSLVVQVL
jgi:hypothetical protein